MLIVTLMALALQEVPSPEPVSLHRTSQIAWDSEQLGGERILYLSVPILPYPDGEVLPLLIVADADVMFGMASETVRLMSFEQSAPAMMVAGISYGSLENWISMRRTDYHPQDGAPGLEEFTAAVLAEAVPLIRANAPAELGPIYIYGHSSAALVALEAAQYPEVTGVIASSVSLEEEPEWAASLAQRYRISPPDAEIFMAVGSEETATREAITHFLEASGLDSRIAPVIVEGGTHMQVVPGVYAEGVRALMAGASD